MKTEDKDRRSALHQQLNLLRECLKLAQTKTGHLMRHDLDGLEAILVREAEMMEQLKAVKRTSGSTEIPLSQELAAEWTSLKSEIGAVAKEIQFVNQANTRLIENGQQFCHVLYQALCPSQTYSPTLSAISCPLETTFQVRY